MKFLDLANRCKRESGRTGIVIADVAAAVGEDKSVCDWVADAWRDVSQMPFNWDFKRKSVLSALAINVVNNTPLSLGATLFSKWAPESDLYKPTVYEASTPANESPLDWVTWEQFRARFVVSTHTPGRPRFWSQNPDRELCVGPRPDLGTYILRADYYNGTVELVANTDEPDCPSEYHMIAAWGGVMKGVAFDAAPELFTRAYNEHERLLMNLIDIAGEKIRITGAPLAIGRRSSNGLPFALP